METCSLAIPLSTGTDQRNHLRYHLIAMLYTCRHAERVAIHTVVAGVMQAH